MTSKGHEEIEALPNAPEGVGAPQARLIDRADLVFRRPRCSALTGQARRALAARLAAGGAYPPVIVRPHPTRAGKYEILDGHNRVELLGQLGRRAVRCEVWPVGQAEADLLAVALNQLRGRPRVAHRARCVRRVVRHLGPAGAAEALGLSPTGLRQQTEPLRQPRPVRDGGGLDLRPLVFHLPAEQAAEVEQTLRRLGGRRTGRGEALVRAIRRTR